MSEWIDACGTEDIEDEDLIAWQHQGQKIAIYKTEKGFFATGLMCTHEEQSLENGFVMDCIIECPLHNGRFDIITGKALGAPAIENLKTYPVKVENDRVFVQVDA